MDKARRYFELRFGKIGMATRKDEGGPDHRMPGKGHLGGPVEYADPRRMGGIGRRQDEGGLAEIELGSHCLHRGGVKRFATDDHCERIAAEARGGEHIDCKEWK